MVVCFQRSHGLLQCYDIAVGSGHIILKLLESCCCRQSECFKVIVRRITEGDYKVSCHLASLILFLLYRHNDLIIFSEFWCHKAKTFPLILIREILTWLLNQ